MTYTTLLNTINQLEKDHFKLMVDYNFRNIVNKLPKRKRKNK